MFLNEYNGEEEKEIVADFNGNDVFLLGFCNRADEGFIGFDIACRPVRLGMGEYTFVTSPGSLEIRRHSGRGNCKFGRLVGSLADAIQR